MSKKLLQTALAQSERLASNLAKGLKVSPEDVGLLEQFNWTVDIHGYAMSSIHGKTIKLHALVFERMTGALPTMNGKRRHHIRHIVADTKLDCRRENINPIASSQGNNCDLNVSMSRRNTSGISGVSWNKRQEKWQVLLSYYSRKINLGRYEDIGLAALVAQTCREARCWLVTQNLNISFIEVREYLQRVARAVIATKDATDYRSLLIINSLIRNDELNSKD